MPLLPPVRHRRLTTPPVDVSSRRDVSTTFRCCSTPVGNPDAEAADSEPEGGGGGGVLGAAVERAAAAGPLAFALLNALVSCVPLPGGPAALSFAAGLLCARPTETSTQLKTLLNPLSLTLSQAAWLSPHTLLTARLAPVRRCGGRHCVLRGKRGRRR